MKILHIGLLSHFTEGMMYQDNILPEMNAKEGHEVVFVTDTYMYQGGELVKVPEEDKQLDVGFRLIRLEYDFIVNNFITNKIQKTSKLNSILEAFHPDTIMYHGVCGYELMDVAVYVKKNPQTLFYVDSHEDFTNTAKNFISKMCYKYINGFFVKKSLSYINKILYLSYETKEYLREMYNIPESMMEFYPLGGMLSSEKEQIDARNKVIKEYNLPENAVILMHSGKLDKLKKTKELIEAFNLVDNPKFYLLIFGAIPNEEKEELESLMDSNSKIIFLGWKSGDDILELLNACDVYCQPGSQSATSQVALCCGCAEIVAPTKSYESMYRDEVLYADSTEQLAKCLTKLSDGAKLDMYKKKANKLAQDKLDYVQLAKRYLQA